MKNPSILLIVDECEVNSALLEAIISKIAPNWPTVYPSADFVQGRGFLYSVQAVKPTKEFAVNLNNVTQYIAPIQGFFVRASSAGNIDTTNTGENSCSDFLRLKILKLIFSMITLGNNPRT